VKLAGEGKGKCMYLLHVSAGMYYLSRLLTSPGDD